MADMFDPEPSMLLLCEEESKDLCFDDLDHECFSGRSEPLIHLPSQSEEAFDFMIERETDYLPKDDYLRRLRCSQLDLGARIDAIDWIWKAHCYYDFGPLSFCLAVNYLDRFLSVRELPIENEWAVQLLALSCLSIAAKMEETNVPQSIDLQVGDPKYVFEANTIQRMEFLLLDTLNWKMNAITPCSFLEYFLNKFHMTNNNIIIKVVNRSMQLILSSTRVIELMEFKPSEIAAAVAISVTSSEIQAVVNNIINQTVSQFTHLEKERVRKCLEMIKEMPVISSSRLLSESPNGVLDADCFSYKCDDELTSTMVIQGSSNTSPEAKRQKLLRPD